jgi:sugar/nucleoside kinase (ribokinase family)
VITVVGNLSLDRVAGGEPRIGGGPYHAGRALRLLGARATLVARCADADRFRLLPRLAALGFPLRLLGGERTASFSFSYDGDVRRMMVDALGETWTPDDARALDRQVRWVHVAPLARSDFPTETVAELARGRTLLLDGQGLVRKARTGPLELDAEFDRSVLEHVSILKLAEEEAEIVGDVEVPELLVTYGSRGALLRARGVETRIGAWAIANDATGAGDGFAAASLASRAAGHAPAAAARRATAVVGAMLR